MDGLCQDVKIVSLFKGIFQQVSGPVVPGHEKHLAIGKNLADFNSRLNPVHAVHDYIADEHIERGGDCSVDCLKATITRRGAGS